MRIIRSSRVEALRFLEPHLEVDPEWGSAEQQVADMTEMLEVSPDSVLFLLAVDEEEDSLKGFVFVTSRPDRPFVFIYSAWMDPKASLTSVADQLFLRVLLWSEEMGKRAVRMETRRHEAFARRWNFQPYSVVMQFEIKEGFEERLLSGAHEVVVHKETQDVERLRGIDKREPGPEGVEEVDGPVGGLDREGAVPGRVGALPRTPPGWVDPSDAAGSEPSVPLQSQLSTSGEGGGVGDSAEGFAVV